MSANSVHRIAYVPGAPARMPGDFREVRTAEYRTWHGRQDMGWCWECLLCGDWGSSEATREAAASHAGQRHQTYCHAVKGCHCPQPHLTTVQAARLGIPGGAEYPYEFAGILFRLAGASRVHAAPSVDRWGQQHGPYFPPVRSYLRHLAAFSIALNEAAASSQLKAA